MPNEKERFARLKRQMIFIPLEVLKAEVVSKCAVGHHDPTDHYIWSFFHKFVLLTLIKKLRQMSVAIYQKYAFVFDKKIANSRQR